MSDAVSDIYVRNQSDDEFEQWFVFWKTINDTANTESYATFTDREEALHFAYGKARHPSQQVWVNGELAEIEREPAGIPYWESDSHIIRGEE